VLFLEHIVWLSLLKISSLSIHELISGTCILSLAYVSVFMPIGCSLGYYGADVHLKIRYGDASSFLLFVQNCFGYSGFCTSTQILVFFSLVLERKSLVF
jgi:hypothetical protein